jgi:hypothetical protein
VLSMSVICKRHGDQRGWEGQQIRKHILSILKTLFPKYSTLYLAVSVPVSLMSLVHIVYAYVFLLPSS